ncbi:ABC transporter ATP-binding protein [Bacteroidota bacterium]
MENILTCENIFRSFFKTKNKKLEVLKGVSLSLFRNKINVIVGASGAGKSTLLHILGGLDRPDSGEVLIDGTNIFKLNDDGISDFRNTNIGFIFQFHHLLPEFTAIENVNIPQLIKRNSPNKSEERSRELLEKVGLSDRLNHKPTELSGGEQQRVAVARALANNPKLILADEPTGNLDSNNSKQLHELFINLKENLGLTFFIVTHNPELMKIADFVLEMRDGKIINQ